MRIYLGMDGGGTGCRAQARLASGVCTAIHTGGPANVYSDPDGAIERIAAVVAAVLAEARGLLPPGVTGAITAVIGLAGASESGAGARLARVLPCDSVTVLGDIDISLSGAFEDEDGIIAAIGTGSVLARQRGGEMRRIGGYGFLLGDEGGGAWIGRAALARSLHARDGLVAGGALAPWAFDRFGDVGGMLAFARAAAPADFAALAPQVVRLAATGCPLAGAILDDAADHVARAIGALQQGGPILPVAFTGGLGPMLADRLAAGPTHPAGTGWPRIAPKGTALHGALWRAERQARATPDNESERKGTADA